LSSKSSTRLNGWLPTRQPTTNGPSAADYLLRIVDAGLCGIIFVAPYFFGGRHDLGRLLLTCLVTVTATAWFARQALLPAARWPRTTAYALLLMLAALVAAQIVPLPQDWLARLSPRTGQLLPMWTAQLPSPAGRGQGEGAQQGTLTPILSHGEREIPDATFGPWQTLSLTPHETTKSLAMLLCYALLFVVVAGRVEDKSDAERLLRWLALSAALMAVFGLLQYFTSDGRFFWFYQHPHRSAKQSFSGPFINRNHFADFLVLGVGPLLAWLLHAVNQLKRPQPRHNSPVVSKQWLTSWFLGTAAAVVVFAVLLSHSRGGAIVLLVAGTILVSTCLYRGIADRRFIYGLATLAILVTGWLSLYGYDAVVQRLDDFAEGSVDDIDQGGIRRMLWAANVAAFEAGWATGAGAGSHCDICPIYMPASFTKEYTHADNDYLQIATENGLGGIVLLAAALVLCSKWCLSGLARATDADVIRLLAAAAAGLAASIAHSCVDFVWYVPACMSVTVILAGCALRLSQLTRAACYRVLPRGRWIERAAVAMLIGGWTVHTYLGPAVAAVYWDRYLRASVTNSEISRQQLTALVANQPSTSAAEQEQLNGLMLSQLEQVVKWDPKFARAHLRLAARCVAQFDLLQQHAENAMNLAQIRDAIATSSFASTDELQSWLKRAVGANLQWLRRAAAEARTAAMLGPLQGEAYVYLSQLAFLDGTSPAVAQAYVDQGLLVRPHDADVLFEIGRQAILAGDVTAALNRWKQCFDDAGPHQRKIVYLLAGRIPAETFIATFQPDWRTLRDVWRRYCETGQQSDIDALLAYTTARTQCETPDKNAIPSSYIWFWQSQLYAEAGRPADALNCLERANACDPRQFFIRRSLARALLDGGRFAEAEPHFRWCLARRPEDKSLAAALVTISKQRLAQREMAVTKGHLNQPSNVVRVASGMDSATTLPPLNR
jgi:O-antigen ligase/tetratricopeptide (TPR) repeat protein